MYKPIEKNKIFERIHKEILHHVMEEERVCIDAKKFLKNTKNENLRSFWEHDRLETTSTQDLKMLE